MAYRQTVPLSLDCSSASDCVQLGEELSGYCSAAGACKCHQDWVLQGGSCVKGGFHRINSQSSQVFDVLVVGLNRHCKTDRECQAGQGDSYCSKLLNICQCR